MRPTQIWLRAAHVVLALVGVAVLVASSTPGTGAVAMLGAVVLFWSGVVWAIVALTAWSRVRPRRRWAVLPLIVGVVALALVTQAPHRVRWAASRSAFDEVVADEAEAGLARSSVRELGRDRSLGLMDADRVYQQGEAVVFEMGEGFIFTTVGYAYLPDGPFPELKINDLGVPEFHRFDGHWYRWSASN